MRRQLPGLLTVSLIVVILCATTRVGLAGWPSGSPFSIYATEGYASVAARPNGDFYVAWRSVGGGGISGRIVHPDGSVELAYLVTAATAYPRVVYNSVDDRFAVFWAQQSGAVFYVYGQEIDASSGQLYGGAFVSNPINTAASSDIIYDAIYCPYTSWYAIAAAVVGDSVPRFPVVQLLNSGGPVGTVNVDAASSDLGKVAIAWDDVNSNFGVAYATFGGGDWDVSLRIFNAFGSPLAGPVDLAASSYDEDDVGLSFNSVAGQYLAAWVRHDGGNQIDNVVARRITSVGSLIGSPANILLAETPDRHLESVEVRYAAGVDEADVSWFQRDSYDFSSDRGKLFNATIDGAGRVTSAPLEVAGKVKDDPGLVSDVPGTLVYCAGPNEYLVAYNEGSAVYGRFLTSIAPTPTPTATDTPTPTDTSTATSTPIPTDTPTATPLPLDAYEPDDVQGQAGVILAGTQNSQEHTMFNPPGLDIDWLTFNAKSNRFYKVYTSNLAGTVDTYLCVTVGPNPQQCNDDRTPGDHSSYLEFLQTEVTDVSAYVKVTNKGGDGENAAYTITVEELGTVPTGTPTPTPVPGDAYEPDDVTPAEIQLGVPQNRSFYPDGDVDRVQVLLKAGVTYVIQTYSLAPGVDTTVEVDGGVVYNDDRALGDPSSYVQYTPGTDHVASIVVENRGQYGRSNSYILSVATNLPTPTPTRTATATFTPAPARDSYDPDETPPHPSIVPNGGAQYHTFSGLGDVDYVTFQAKVGHRYEVLTLGLNEAIGVDTRLTVASAYWYLTNDDAQPPSRWSRVAFDAPDNEEILVTIENMAPPGAAWGESAYYQVKVVDSFVGTPGTPTATPQNDATATAQAQTATAQAETATPGPGTPTATPNPCPDAAYEDDAGSPALIGVGQTMARAFCAVGDVDYVQFLAKAGDEYTARTQSLGSLVDTRISATVDGVLYENDDCSGSAPSCISFVPAADQWVSITIEQMYGYYGSDGGARYSVNVSRTSVGTATPTPSSGVCDTCEPDEGAHPAYIFGQPQQRCFAATGDIDYSTFLAKAGKTYTVRTLSVTGGADTYLRITAGSTVICQDDDGGGGLASQCVFSLAADASVLIEITNRGLYSDDARYTLEIQEGTSIQSSTSTPTPYWWSTPTPYPTSTPIPTSTPARPTAYPTSTRRPTTSPYYGPTTRPTPTPFLTPSRVITGTQTVTATAAAGQGGSGGQQPGTTITPTGVISNSMRVEVFVDANKSKIMDAGEGVGGLLVVAYTKSPPWQAQAVTRDGEALIYLPAAVRSETEVFVRIPYLHRSGKFKVPKEGGQIEAQIVLPLPRYPVYLP